MGLDMYLYLQKDEYVGEHYKWPSNAQLTNEYPAELASLAKADPVVQRETRYRAAYWRKANAIHKWFVNFAGEKDTCQKIYLNHKALQELVDKCKEALDRPAEASKILPTKGGFFFGTTAYDEWYFQNLKNTIAMLEPVIEVLKKQDEAWEEFKANDYKGDQPEHYECIYQASW